MTTEARGEVNALGREGGKPVFPVDALPGFAGNSAMHKRSFHTSALALFAALALIATAASVRADVKLPVIFSNSGYVS